MQIDTRWKWHHGLAGEKEEAGMQEHAKILSKTLIGVSSKVQSKVIVRIPVSLIKYYKIFTRQVSSGSSVEGPGLTKITTLSGKSVMNKGVVGVTHLQPVGTLDLIPCLPSTIQLGERDWGCLQLSLPSPEFPNGDKLPQMTPEGTAPDLDTDVQPW
ncbi:hypothetical protein CRENBAI_000887 [Crenichthys baileyi]|uniref:Uncharacterized protein n=1 Tax=Crenichthys baileyi TaxID=28760 RepID=A0AAV9S2P3_9TELE